MIELIQFFTSVNVTCWSDNFGYPVHLALNKRSSDDSVIATISNNPLNGQWHRENELGVDGHSFILRFTNRSQRWMNHNWNFLYGIDYQLAAREKIADKKKIKTSERNLQEKSN